ncbi:hypothetical protein HDU97_006412 [Phlyctochytrium planicorne]|nr:hypothetical protein HDU97_006412 [Phlyctochytrium planicorne]
MSEVAGPTEGLDLVMEENDPFAIPPEDDAESQPYTEHFSSTDLLTAIKVLTVYTRYPELKTHAKQSRGVRHLLDISRQLIDMSPEELRERKKKRAREKTKKDHQVIAQTGIRETRKIKMVGMGGMGGGSVRVELPPLIGTLENVEKFVEDNEKRNIEAMHAEVREVKLIEVSETQDVPVAQAKDEEASNGTTENPTENAENSNDAPSEPRKLNYQRSCHICTNPFFILHHFYDQLCPRCAEFNFQKRSFSADMRGRVCIVTGARLKIGYAIGLKLLKMGATVIATTRFPHDAAKRYASEPDASSYAGRLHVYGLDFRDMQMLHHFTAHVRLTFGRLDVLINNAAQTVRKPPAFYEHLIQDEMKGLDESVARIVNVVDVFRASGGRYVFGRMGGKEITEGQGNQAESLHIVEEVHPVGPAGEEIVLSTLDPSSNPMVSSSATSSAFNPSATMSQLPVLETDAMDSAESKALFPPGLYDRDDQQVDLRVTNSWKLELGQISTLEMVECHVINSFAPWILISELKGLMMATGEPGQVGEESAKTWDKYVVNVSAMEGQFYRNKSIYHPHTNMAKASLNMMTRTAAAGFAAASIFMTAVDTGWITDENPVHLWSQRASQPPPLDEWDAAMRVLDPVLKGVRGEEKLWGVFLKNYRPTRCLHEAFFERRKVEQEGDTRISKNSMTEYKFKVGMTCSGCSGAVNRILSKTDGVSSFDISLETQTVVVNTDTLSKDQVFEAIKKSGKPVEAL